ncbi:exported hypothetical protein [Frankia sp. AiPs1]
MVSRTVCSSSHSTWVPSSASMPRTTSTSAMRGTRVRVHGSGVSRAATISLVTEFLAPDASTEPRSGTPPLMRYHRWSVLPGVPRPGVLLPGVVAAVLEAPTGYLPWRGCGCVRSHVAGRLNQTSYLWTGAAGTPDQPGYLR